MGPDLKTIVVNLHDSASQGLITEARAAGRFVDIRRPSRWSNPFSHLEHSRARFKVRSVGEALASYALWLPDQVELMADLHMLVGKVLGCVCAPRPCHGYILARLADEL